MLLLDLLVPCSTVVLFHVYDPPRCYCCRIRHRFRCRRRPGRRGHRGHRLMNGLFCLFVNVNAFVTDPVPRPHHPRPFLERPQESTKRAGFCCVILHPIQSPRSGRAVKKTRVCPRTAVIPTQNENVRRFHLAPCRCVRRRVSSVCHLSEDFYYRRGRTYNLNRDHGQPVEPQPWRTYCTRCAD